MRKIIANNIRNYLGRNVKGSVSVRDNGKTLFISIVYTSIVFRTKVENLDTLILNGYSAQHIGCNILIEYQKYLKSIFFK